jgi:hypothetical protein
LKLELAKCEQLMNVLDESPAVKPAKAAKATKPAATPVAQVTPEGVAEVELEEEADEPVESKAKTAARRNGGESSKRQQVERLLDEGMKPKEIAEALDAKISYIYSIKREHSPGR